MKPRRPPVSRMLSRWLPTLAFAVVGGLSFAAAQMLAARGFSRGLTNDLIGMVLLGASAKIDTAQIISAYPPITYLTMLSLQKVTGLQGLAAARLLTALLAGALGAAWMASLLRARYKPLRAVVFVALLVLNPLFLRAVAGGPEFMLVLWGTWLLAANAFTLRATGGVNALILFSAALVILMFSMLLGAVFALAAMPFLLLAVPADIKGRSHVSAYMVLLFPVWFSLVSFAFVNWLLLHDALAFIPARLYEVSLRSDGIWQKAAMAAALGVISAPILAGLIARTRTRRLVRAPALGLAATLPLAGALAILVGATESIAAPLAPAIALSAAVAARWPLEVGRSRRVAVLLFAGLLGGCISLFLDRSNAQFLDALLGTTRPAERQTGAGQLGHFLAGRSGVLFDAVTYPAVVAARGSAEGLITSADDIFSLSLLRKRIEPAAVSVAVAAPDLARNADAISRVFPDLYSAGVPGFRLVYDQDGWRVWTRDLKQEAQR